MKKNELKIEYSEVLSETYRRNYEKIILTKLKYKDNPYNFIDIRIFQKGEDENENEIFHPTKKVFNLRKMIFRN